MKVCFKKFIFSRMPKKPFNLTVELDTALKEMESILETCKSSQDDEFEDLKNSMKNLLEQTSAEDSFQDLKILNCNQAQLIQKIETTDKLENFTLRLRNIVAENARMRNKKQNSADTLPRAKKSKPDSDFLIIDESNSAINNENYSSCHIDKTLDYLLERRKTPPPSFSPERLKSPPRPIKNLWCPRSPTKDTPVCYWGI